VKRALKVFLKIGFVTFIIWLITSFIAAVVEFFVKITALAVIIRLIPIVVGLILCLKLQARRTEKIVSIILLPFVIIIPLVILGVGAAILLAYAQQSGMIP
jgi:hypothetical protein